jgi:hypothetical protein
VAFSFVLGTRRWSKGILPEVIVLAVNVLSLAWSKRSEFWREKGKAVQFGVQDK